MLLIFINGGVKMCKVINLFTREEMQEETEPEEVKEVLKDIEEVTRTSNSLKNEYCSISFDETKKIVDGSDLKDQNNWPCFYTKKKRNIKKAWEKLTAEFTAETTMYGAIHILDQFDLNCHSWCSMD